jgi:hypothetical protein
MCYGDEAMCRAHCLQNACEVVLRGNFAYFDSTFAALLVVAVQRSNSRT